MLTSLNLKRGEEKLVGAGSRVGTRPRRAHLSQSPPQIPSQIASKSLVSMSHEGGADNMPED